MKSGPASEKIYRCPLCGDSKNPHKGHLYINAGTGVFRCQKCNQEGNALTLYAKHQAVDNKTAYKQLIKKFKPKERVKLAEPPKKTISTKQTNAVYREFIKLLRLNCEHAMDLRRRGLSDAQISELLFRSLPQEPKSRWRIANYLAKKMSIDGVPGFFAKVGKYGKYWDFVSHQGYLIPILNLQGEIQAMQIRLDNGNYMWFSSHGLPNGTSSGAPSHYTGGNGRVWVTEGPLKATVASALIGAPFIGIPGVGIYKNVAGILTELSEKNPIIAFDSDQKTNKNVAKALADFLENLKLNGFHPENATWQESLGKGIDDVLVRLHKNEVLVVTFMIGKTPVRIKKTVTTTVSVG